ncbi:MAG TPA: hypothetical protein PKY78_03975 [Candidatus Omnitrophota bacterium]|nr:hypothetical protein [Candidatus Omnitrophota bacterium]HPS20128.1 hypothetical protein [Candidatus Omnitrophota bacterium]
MGQKGNIAKEVLILSAVVAVFVTIVMVFDSLIPAARWEGYSAANKGIAVILWEIFRKPCVVIPYLVGIYLLADVVAWAIRMYGDLAFAGAFVIGFLLHIWSAVEAFLIYGMPAAVITFMLPVISEFFWFIRMWMYEGTMLNPYCLTVVGYLTACALAAKLLEKKS